MGREDPARPFGLIVLALILAAATQADSPELLGYWTNEARSVVVFIAPCGEGAFCGTVQWASDKANADARRGGTSPLVGTQLLRDFVPSGPGRWTGKLFVADLNKTSKAQLLQQDDDHMEVRGCAVGRLLCKSQVWQRTEPQ